MGDYIDIYCERLGPGLWAEPVNAITNAAFFIAALTAFLLARREGKLNIQTVILIALIIVIGTGSTLFHTTATFWAMMADSLPILFYQIAFLAFYTCRVMDAGWKGTCLMLAAFAVTVSVFYRLPEEWLNGSLSYAPAFIFLLGLGIWHWRNRKTEPLSLLLAAGVFALSLTLRSLDMSVCPAFPLGTHFAWHVLNGVVLYLTARAWVLNGKRV